MFTTRLRLPGADRPYLFSRAGHRPRRPQHFLYRGVYGTALFVLMCTAWLVLAGTQIIRSVGDMAKFGSISVLHSRSAATGSAYVPGGAARGQQRRAGERQKTLILLLMTRLTNHELVLGKLLASLLDVLVMLATAAPIFMLLTLFGGVSAAQVGRVFAVTLATILAAGSLGSTVALARDKTFQSLAMTALILMIWIGAWEAAAVLVRRRGASAACRSSRSPRRPARFAPSSSRLIPIAIRSALFAAADTWFVVAALVIAAPAEWPGDRAAAGLESRARIAAASRDEPKNGRTKERRRFFGSGSRTFRRKRPAPAHVDARVRQVDQKSRAGVGQPGAVAGSLHLGVRPQSAGDQGGLLAARS